MIDIDKIIGDQLLKANEGHSRERQVGEYYCTDLGNCIRKTWYKYQGIELEDEGEEETIRMLKVFERGNLLHEWITERLRKHVEEIGGYLKEEVSVAIPNLNEQFVVRGRIDNLIATEDGFDIIEVKTTARIRKTGMPLPHHVAQVMPYLLYAPNAKAGILYLEPNTLKTAFYEVTYDMFAMQDLWRKANDLHQALLNNLLPDAEAKLKKVENWQCKYCEFKGMCDKEELRGTPQDYVPVVMPSTPITPEVEEEPSEANSFAEEVEQVEKELVMENKETAEEKWQKLKKRMEEAEEDLNRE